MLLPVAAENRKGQTKKKPKKFRRASPAAAVAGVKEASQVLFRSLTITPAVFHLFRVFPFFLHGNMLGSKLSLPLRLMVRWPDAGSSRL